MNGKKDIFLDNASTTRVDEEVRDAMLPYFSEFYGNPSSVHQFGKKAMLLRESARELIADFLGCKPTEIFFTSCGTESNNTAIKGFALNFLGTQKNHIITSNIEHPSVIQSVLFLKEKFGFEITVLKADNEGRVSPEQVQDAITEKTFLITVMHANNELGTINDIKSISEIAKSKGIYFHSDTVQSIGKIKFKLNEIPLNSASLSAHKIYGPKGIGVLYLSENSFVEKLLHGGGQERGLRSGTESIPLIAGLKKTIEILINKIDEDIEHYTKLNEYLKSQLTKYFREGISYNSPKENVLQNIVNIKIDYRKFNIDPEMLIVKFDLNGIAVSAGSACHSGALKPSEILLELGLSEKEALSSIRISFGRYNTKDDIDFFIDVLKRILQ
ncbi:MAG: cysteine desulfurase [Ignavibacteria bacterium]|nr:cysteine desulfurase [Ignavibacteria bacterium]